MSNEAIPPRKHRAAVTFILSGTANLGVSFPIRLNCIFLGAFLAFPLLLTVLSAEVLFNSGEITQRSRRVMVDTRWFRADIHPLPHLLARPLPQLPWQIVTSPVKLQILVPLKPFVANFAYESVRRH